MSTSPKPSLRGGKGLVFVLLLLAGVGGGAFWVMQETLDKGGPSLPAFLTGAAGNSTAAPAKPDGTGTSETASLRGVPPAPGAPGGNSSGLAQGSLPGEKPSVVVPPPGAQPVPGAGTGQIPPGAESAPFIAGGGDVVLPVNQAGIPKVTEDSVVRLAFVDDLAAFLAGNYWPKGMHPSATRGGITTVSIKWANLRYGGELQGMRRGDDLVQARASVLRYILNPSMLEGLYGLYADRFVAVLEAAASARRVGPAEKERALSGAEKKEMLQIYAGQARGLGAAISAYIADPVMRARVEALHAAEKATTEANRVYMESQGAYEEAQESGKRGGIAEARKRMEQDAGVYQSNIQNREKIRTELVTAMKGGSARSIGDDSLIFVATWLYRRGTANPEALHAAARVLQSAGGRLAGAAKE